MEIIILGIVLFILGVGATIVYDKYKDKATQALKAQQERVAIRKEAEAKFAAAHAATTASKKKSQEEVINQLLGLNEKLKQPNVSVKPRVTVDPNSLKFGLYREGDMPTEAKYMEELFEDVSIKSTMTVQELISKIEKLKGRSGPKR